MGLPNRRLFFCWEHAFISLYWEAHDTRAPRGIGEGRRVVLFASSESSRRVEVFDGSCSMRVKCNRSEDLHRRFAVWRGTGTYIERGRH
jgi:hypothetical protein